MRLEKERTMCQTTKRVHPIPESTQATHRDVMMASEGQECLGLYDVEPRISFIPQLHHVLEVNTYTNICLLKMSGT